GSDAGFDDCTSDARYFLRIIKEYHDHDSENAEHKRTMELTLKAFLLYGTLYIAAVTRSCAVRVLYTAMPFATEVWKSNYNTEKDKLAEDMQDEQLKALDEKWEEFFEGGAHYLELYQLCAEQGFTELAIRLRLLHESFQRPDSFKVD